MRTQNNKILRMTELGILLALVVVLQSISSLGVVTICLCLIPITMGAMLLDWKGGAILGFAFGIIALFWGIVGKDVFTLYLFSANPIMTILICIVKGTLAGIVPALLYKWLSKYEYKNSKLIASIVASLSAPIVNTGIFAIGCMIIKNDVTSVAGQLGVSADNFVTLLFVVLIGFNFFIEFGVNAVFSPALHKLTTLLNKRLLK
ncbi:MAG: hypothetical protein II984_02225 [Clostridia bacterium]|nr:hypothetical protein [Clostridia bacterium]